MEDSIKDGLIITATAPAFFFFFFFFFFLVLKKAAKIKAPEASLDVRDILKLASGICGGLVEKHYTVYKKWIND